MPRFEVSLSKSRLTVVNSDASGGRPFLLFVHGSWHGSWCFENYLGFFESKGIGAAAIDLRGHGGLTQDEVFVRSGQREMSSDVVDAIKHLDRDIVLVGHSAGAAIAGIAASKLSTLGLVLLAPSPPGQLKLGNTLPAVPDGKPIPPPDCHTAQTLFFPNASTNDCQLHCEKLVAESPTLLNDRRLRITEIPRERIPAPSLYPELGNGQLKAIPLVEPTIIRPLYLLSQQNGRHVPRIRAVRATMVELVHELVSEEVWNGGNNLGLQPNIRLIRNNKRNGKN